MNRPRFSHARLLIKRAIDEVRPATRVQTSVVGRRTMVRRDSSEVRAEVVSKLVQALGEVEALAKTAGKRARKGTGGVPAKARWYQIMASIAQTLDHVLRSEDLDKIQERMIEMEKTIDELQRTIPKTG